MMFCLPLGISVPRAFAKGSRVRIAFCDSQRAMAESKAGKKMRNDLEALLKSESRPLEEKKKELNRLRLELDKKSTVMDESLKKEKEDAYFDAQRKLKRMSEDLKRALNKKQRELTMEIINKFRKTVRRIGIDEGYEVILPKKVGLYYSKDLDITNLVIRKLDRSR